VDDWSEAVVSCLSKDGSGREGETKSWSKAGIIVRWFAIKYYQRGCAG
jgi:hypothetical protein